MGSTAELQLQACRFLSWCRHWAWFSSRTFRTLGAWASIILSSRFESSTSTPADDDNDSWRPTDRIFNWSTVNPKIIELIAIESMSCRFSGLSNWQEVLKVLDKSTETHWNCHFELFCHGRIQELLKIPLLNVAQKANAKKVQCQDKAFWFWINVSSIQLAFDQLSFYRLVSNVEERQKSVILELVGELSLSSNFSELNGLRFEIKLPVS